MEGSLQIESMEGQCGAKTDESLEGYYDNPGDIIPFTTEEDLETMILHRSSQLSPIDTHVMIEVRYRHLFKKNATKRSTTDEDIPVEQNIFEALYTKIDKDSNGLTPGQADVAGCDMTDRNNLNTVNQVDDNAYAKVNKLSHIVYPNGEQSKT